MREREREREESDDDDDDDQLVDTDINQSIYQSIVSFQQCARGGVLLD